PPTSTLFPYPTLFRSHLPLHRQPPPPPLRRAARLSQQLLHPRRRRRQGDDGVGRLLARHQDAGQALPEGRRPPRHLLVSDQHAQDRKSTRLNSSHVAI